MGIPEKSVVTFRIFGENLNPSEITTALKCEPHKIARRGEARVIRGQPSSYIEPLSSWRVSASDRTPEDIPSQVQEILGMLNPDPAVWADLSSRYQMDMFCGVFISSTNDGLEFSPALLAELSSRGIGLNFDIYDSTE